MLFYYRLPGWDKGSYGYHGDDGNAFCGSGQGQVYGPTFTTGDVIGCGLNLIDGSCFYTKNGHNLGTAFTGNDFDTLLLCISLQSPILFFKVLFSFLNAFKVKTEWKF